MKNMWMFCLFVCANTLPWGFKINLPHLYCSVSGILISRFSNQRVLDVSAEWTEDSNNSSHSSMQYAFRVTCDPAYYGAGCANLCRKRDDQFGHYTCSPTGERVCLSGWQGDYCTTRKYLKLALYRTNIKLKLSYKLTLNIWQWPIMYKHSEASFDANPQPEACSTPKT